MDIGEILMKNKNKNFVQRILNPRIFPVLDNGDGSHSTHLMSWTEADGKYYVYPNILQGKDGKLVKRDGADGFREAMKAGEVIEVDNPETADWFSKNYKQYWDNMRRVNYR